MEGMYSEYAVKRVNGMKEALLKLAIIMVNVYVLLISFLMWPGIITLIIACLWILVYIYWWPRFNLEFEYIFCDGQIDFDFIFGNNKRKHKLRIDLENAVLMAPYNDDDIVNNKDVRTICNYFSGNYEANPYALIVRKNDRLFKIIFEPDEKMISSIRMKMPRKVKLYPENKSDNLSEE